MTGTVWQEQRMIGEHFFTIIKNNRDDNFWDQYIGRAFRFIGFVETARDSVKCRKITNKYDKEAITSMAGKGACYFFKLDSYHPKPTNPCGKSALWDFDEIRPSTKEEIDKYWQIKMAEKV